MSYTTIPTRVDGVDSNSASDINALMANDEALDLRIDALEPVLSVIGFMPISQCALYGSVDATGYANFLSKDGSNNNVKLSATSTNLYLAFANGFNDYGESNIIAKISADIVPTAWTGLTTNGTYYLWADIAAGVITYGKTATTVAPDYVYAKAAAATNTKHSYVIPERKMYVDNGSTWSAVTRVFLGHVVVSGSAVNSVVTYAYKGMYISPLTAMPVNNTLCSMTHNIGCEVTIHDIFVECVISSSGYAVGDRIHNLVHAGPTDGNKYQSTSFSNRLTCGFNSGYFFNVLNKSDATLTYLTSNTNFKYGVIAKRGF
jgi:hypothetical protein